MQRTVSRFVGAVVLTAAFAPAIADDARAVSIEAGKTVEYDVGYAIGVACDDPETVAASMRTAKTADTNILVLTGKRAGKTMCRAGTDPNRVSYVFEIVVTPKRR